jgi:transposase
MPGIPEKATHDYVRYATTTLFAALEVATGRVEQACLPRHRHQEFLRFLKQLAEAYPRRKLHLVVDNYATHKHPAVRAWLARNPRLTLHFTPTSGSWPNLVEIFFSIMTRQAIRRGSFASVKDLTAAISRFIDGWNDSCHPFVRTKTADELLDHCRPGQETSPRPPAVPLAFWRWDRVPPEWQLPWRRGRSEPPRRPTPRPKACPGEHRSTMLVRR